MVPSLTPCVFATHHTRDCHGASAVGDHEVAGVQRVFIAIQRQHLLPSVAWRTTMLPLSFATSMHEAVGPFP